MKLVICDTRREGYPLLYTSRCRYGNCRGTVIHTRQDPPSEILCDRHYRGPVMPAASHARADSARHAQALERKAPKARRKPTPGAAGKPKTRRKA